MHFLNRLQVRSSLSIFRKHDKMRHDAFLKLHCHQDLHRSFLWFQVTVFLDTKVFKTLLSICTCPMVVCGLFSGGGDTWTALGKLKWNNVCYKSNVNLNLQTPKLSCIDSVLRKLLFIITACNWQIVYGIFYHVW